MARKFKRNPNIKNKYKLTPKILRTYVVGDRSKICKPLFWRNNAIKGWCISGNTAKTRADHDFGTYNEFWIGIYDDDAPSYKGKFRFNFSSYGGMCGFEFDKFFDMSDIENEDDLRVQEAFMEKINYLIDEGIIVKPKK